MRWWLLFITPFVFASEVSVPGAAFYRFSDDAGNRVLADKIPPRFVKYGYEVLDRRLFVIHRVAPAPTAEELAAMERANDRPRSMHRNKPRTMLCWTVSPACLMSKRPSAVNWADWNCSSKFK